MKILNICIPISNVFFKNIIDWWATTFFFGIAHFNINNVFFWIEINSISFLTIPIFFPNKQNVSHSWKSQLLYFASEKSSYYMIFYYNEMDKSDMCDLDCKKLQQILFVAGKLRRFFHQLNQSHKKRSSDNILWITISTYL